MLIAKCAFAHISKLDGTLRACIHEPIATLWVELGSSNDLCQFLHVGRLDINNVEALILDVEVPQIYSQIVTADEGFPITVDRDAIDMVGMGVCVGSTRHSGNNSIVMCHARKLKRSSVCKGEIRIRSRRSTTAPKGSTGCEVMREIVFSHHL